MADRLWKAGIEKIGHKRAFIRSLHLELIIPSNEDMVVR
jgi:hypothetical protein